jgi:hypothetical protein
MKTFYLVFALICWAALLQENGYGVQPKMASLEPSLGSSAQASETHPNTQSGAPADEGEHQTRGRPADEKPGRRHVPNQNHALSHASPVTASRARKLPNNHQERSTFGYQINLGQPASGGSRTDAGEGQVQTDKASSPSTARPYSVLQPADLPHRNMHHRNPNPAIISGSVNSKTRNAGGLNGSRMHGQR